MLQSSVFFLIAGILSSAAITIVLKIFSRQTGNRYGILLGNYLVCILCAFLMMPDKTLIARPERTTILCAIAAGILFVAGLVFMQSSISRNGAILTSAFSKSGLIVPLLISALFLGDSIRVLQIPGIILILVSFWLISTDKKPPKTPGYKKQMSGSLPVLLLFAVLLSCGSADAMAKIFENVGKRSQDQLYFLILFVTAAFITLILLFAEYKRTGKKPVLKEFLIGMLVGIPNYFSSSFLLKALNGLPSFVVYPCFSAGTLLLVTIIGAAVFKEKPGKKAWIGLIMIVISLIWLNLDIL